MFAWLARWSMLVLAAGAVAGAASAAIPPEVKALLKSGDREGYLRQVRPLAEQGDTEAQYMLGYAYEKGAGVPLDQTEGARWMARSADGGFVMGQIRLAQYYIGGVGVERDLVQAYKWFTIAATLWGEASGGPLLDQRNKLLPEMTPQQVSEAERQAKAWKPRG